MAHYAFLDKNNVVTEVITGIDETETIEGLDPETWYGNFRGQKCVRTSYSSSIRFNYAGIGFTYDLEADAFIAPPPECGHKELFLNDKFKWNCQGCDLENKKVSNEANTI
jgi:hypothetical protein